MTSQISKSHAQAEHLQFVDQRDVDAAIDIFQQLGHLGGGGRGDGNGALEDGSVEGAGQFRSLRVDSAHNFGDVAAGHSGVAGIFALGGKGNEEFFFASEAAAGGLQAKLVFFFENRHHHFFGGAGISCALEHDQLAGLKMRGDGMRGVGDIAEIGLVILIQRRGDADDDRVHLFDVRVIGGGGKALRFGVLDFFAAMR